MSLNISSREVDEEVYLDISLSWVYNHHVFELKIISRSDKNVSKLPKYLD